MKKKKSSSKVPNLTAPSSFGTGPDLNFEHFYLNYRNDFLHFGKDFGLSEDDILDAFQEAVIVFFEQKTAGKLDQLKSTEKTYLFSIGKYKLIDNIRDKVKMEKYRTQLNTLDFDQTALDKIILTQSQENLKAAIGHLGAKCKELLLLFYYQRFSIAAIREKMGYNTDNVVKANKSRCMKTLRNIAQSKDLI